MNIHRSTFALVTLTALAVSIAYLAGARRPAAPTPPTIATVRMQPLFDGLLERAEAKTEVDTLEDGFRAEQRTRQASIAALQEKLDQANGAKQRRSIQEQLDLKSLELRFWLQEAANELESEKALRLIYLYRNIKTAIQSLAETEGYDLVFLDNSMDEPTFDREARIAPQLQVLGQITSRNILYLNSTLDVTEDLISRMNNEYRAAQDGP